MCGLGGHLPEGIRYFTRIQCLCMNNGQNKRFSVDVRHRCVMSPWLFYFVVIVV